MGVRAAVAGASGYAGGELLRLLAAHPDLELGTVTADSSAGRPVGEVHPHLAGLPAVAGRTFEIATAGGLAGHDVVFLALPAGRSAAMAALAGRETRIVDLGPDFRLGDASAWARHYSEPHAGRWVTGLPELPGARGRIRVATRVAVPGCFATAAILALAPLARAGLIELGDVVIVAASGTSGAGRAPRQDLLGSEVMGAVSAYQAGGAHRHIPEIEQALDEAASASSGATTRVSFTPVLAPMPRGILAICTAPLLAGTTGPRLRDAVTAACSGEPYLTLLPDGRWPTTAAVAGSNGVHLQVAADLRAGRAVAIAAIDNLGKGAAGHAVQNANLMLGLPETAGLTACGVAP